jgi:glycosyltransferase involved in cell wall biosynthesis
VRVGVCDFPSCYAFPPWGYGGIERWLWAVAVGAHQVGAEVCLLGPAWREGLAPRMRRLPVRLEDIRPGDEQFREVDRLRLDLLVVGHEYPSHAAWRATAMALGCAIATFQHDPHFRHAGDAFDGQRTRLYCYSPEMVERYRAHGPQQTLSVQFGFGEDARLPVVCRQDLVWIGRVDADKAPHLAAMAAARLGQRLRIVGPTPDPHYLDRHRATLTAPNIDFVGELAGGAKLQALTSARTLVYSCARGYVEAGAAVFGEALRCGTPVAAVTWRPGTCAHAALCAHTGALAELDPNEDDSATASVLAEAIITAEQLDPSIVQEIGLTRFDPVPHFHALARAAC